MYSVHILKCTHFSTLIKVEKSVHLEKCTTKKCTFLTLIKVEKVYIFLNVHFLNFDQSWKCTFFAVHISKRTVFSTLIKVEKSVHLRICTLYIYKCTLSSTLTNYLKSYLESFKLHIFMYNVQQTYGHSNMCKKLFCVVDIYAKKIFLIKLASCQ